MTVGDAVLTAQLREGRSVVTLCRSSLQSQSASQACQHSEQQARKFKIRMIEDIEELSVEAELRALGQLKPFRQIKIAPRKIQGRTSRSALSSRTPSYAGCNSRRLPFARNSPVCLNRLFLGGKR